MSIFQAAVVKAEKRTLKVLDGTLPYIEVSRKYEARFYFAAAVIVALWLTFAVQIFQLSWFFSRATLVLAVFWSLVAAIYGVYFFFRGYRTKAMYQRLELRQKRDAREIEKARTLSAQVAAQEAAQAAQERAEIENVNQYHRAIYQMRLTLLRQLESGIRDHVASAKEEWASEAWEPDAAGIERIYERLRAGIKASQAPEYGLLHRTTDGVVLRVLGDRSCLPPDMTDQQIAARHLPQLPTPPIQPRAIR